MVWVPIQTKVVQNANRVKQVHSVTSKVKNVNLVQKESTAKAKKRTILPRLRIQLSVWVVLWDTLNLLPNKRRACPASKVNTTTNKVLQVANFAKQTPPPKTKTERRRVILVRVEERPPRAALNVRRVNRDST